MKLLNKFKFWLFAFFACALALILSLPTQATNTIDIKDIDNFAASATVMVARGLQKGDLEEKREWDPGSGVIIARNDNTYYVATNSHVVKQPNPDNTWGVRTYDGEVHKVQDNGDIIRFGKYGGSGNPVDGYDLSVIKFQSDRNYQVAVVGDSSKLNPNESVFVSGWPKPEDQSKRRERIFRQGKLAKVNAQPATDGGYSLLYDNRTRPGMSGGPVFNSSGELIGIHGRGRGREGTYCVDKQLSVKNSCGIQSLHFIQQAELKGLQLSYTVSPITTAQVMNGRKVDRNSSDVIEDVYKIFTIGALRRDAGFGSGGCGSLLLGDRCP